MLNCREITQSGHYLYYGADGAPPVMVEIRPAEAPEPQLEVRFTGSNDWQLLDGLRGSFSGPITQHRVPVP